MLKKILCLCLVIVLSAVSVLTAAGMGGESYVQLVHIRKAAGYDVQTTVYFETLEEAVLQAESGDIIEVFADVTVTAPILIPDGMELTFISGTKREHTAIFGRDAFESTDPDAPARTVKKDFDGTLFVLGKNSRMIMENIILDGNSRGGDKGGLVLVGPAAVLTVRQGVIMKKAALGENSAGGAVYVTATGSASFDNTLFENNSAVAGPDVFAETGAGVTGFAEVGTEAASEADTTPGTDAPEDTAPIETQIPGTEPETAGKEPDRPDSTQPDGTAAADPQTQGADGTGTTQGGTGCRSLLGCPCAAVIICAAAALCKGTSRKKH